MAVRIYSFHKGLRLDKADWELEAGEVPDVVNFIYDEDRRRLRKRLGLQRIISSAAAATPIRGLHRSYVGGSAPYTLVAVGNTLYRVADSSPSWSPVATGLSGNAPVRFESWLDKVFIVDGADGLQVWDGSSVTTVVGAPAGCRFVRHFADRLFVASSVEYPDTVFYSDLLDPTVWADNETQIPYVIDVSPGDDQRITGIVRTRDQLTIFKTHATYYLRGYDPEEWVLQRVSDGVGCIAPGSIVEKDGRTIWLSDRGVYMDDGTHFYRIGAAIQPYIRTLTRAQQEKAVGTMVGWNYYLFFPETPDGPVAFIYHVVLEAWLMWKLGVPIGAVTAKELPTDNPGWIGGHAQVGYIYHGETGGTDDGDPIAASIRLPDVGRISPELTLDLRRVALDAVADADDAFTLGWSIDGKTPVERNFTGDKPVIYSVPASPGQTLQFVVSIDGTGTTSTLNGLAAEVRVKRRRWA